VLRIAPSSHAPSSRTRGQVRQGPALPAPAAPLNVFGGGVPSTQAPVRPTHGKCRSPKNFMAMSIRPPGARIEGGSRMPPARL
jgi:hypothetical protein